MNWKSINMFLRLRILYNYSYLFIRLCASYLRSILKNQSVDCNEKYRIVPLVCNLSIPNGLS